MSGRRAPFLSCLFALATILAAPASARGLADTEVTANQGVAAGGDITGNVTIGMPPEQVQALVIAFTQQLGVAAAARIETEAKAATLASQLGFNRDAVIGFFRILGEREVPPEQMLLRLGETATAVAIT